ncbi:MAG: class I ribonucleotide reductase maintenance protein YfaE [Ostreibacterium sp.]
MLKENTIIIETNDCSFELLEGENLLDALVGSGHEIEYQCRSGYCGSCRVKTIFGQVKYSDSPLAHVHENEILPCCCRLTGSIKIDVYLRKVNTKQQGELFD